RAAGEAHRLEGGLHLGRQVVGQRLRPLRVLAFGGDRDTAGEDLSEIAGVELPFGAGNGGGAGHVDGPVVWAPETERGSLMVCVSLASLGPPGGCRWQATLPSGPSASTGARLSQSGRRCAQRGWKGQPDGGLSGSGKASP